MVTGQLVEEAGSEPRGVAGQVLALVEAARPTHWLKNLLVAAAPLAAGELADVQVIVDTALAFVTFCLLASSVYLVNDVIDLDADRHHPQKRHRALARSAASSRIALGLAGALAIGGLGVALFSSIELPVVAAVYLVLSLAYTFGLKHQPVLDMAVVAGGFLLRAIAGGVAAGLPLSRWFLIVAAFGSLFMVAGKRYSELVTLGDDAHRIRPSLAAYSPSYLRFVWGVAAGVTILAYCLWAFEVGDRPGETPWGPLSIVPFVLAVLRYSLDIDGARASAPVELVLQDRLLLGLGVCWLGIFALGAFRV